MKPYSYMSQDNDGQWYLLPLTEMSDFETLVNMQRDDPEDEQVARQMEGYAPYKVRGVDIL